MNLSGQKILVTGGSRGIGAGIAKTLADQGATVAVAYSSNPASADKVVSELKGSGHFAIKLDVSSEESVQSGIESIISKWTTIDGVVNNAGITRDQLLLRMKTEDFDQVIQTNLRGTFLVTRAVLKGMLKARKGSIVNISSVIGSTGNAGQSNYAASKAGLEAFTKSIALEVGSRQIRLNCIAPGFIVTEMTDALNDAQKQAILAKVPLGVFGEVQDIAKCVGFLLSDDAKYITGQTIHVNGGMYLA